jgi:K+-sensing histidine kinase KdpD
MASEARMVLGRPGTAAQAAPRGANLERSRSGLPGAPGDPARSTLEGVAGEGLRTTLALIGGYGQSLLHLALDEETRRRCAEGLLAAADSLAELTDRILELAVTEDRPPELRRRPVAVDWLASRLERAGSGSSDAGSVRYHATPDLPFVDVDPLWMGHALRLLVARVRRRQAGSGRTVTILAHEAGSVVVLSIRGEDAEPGPRARVRDDPAAAESVRASWPASADDDLVLCRRIVEANGGELWPDGAHGPDAVALRLPARPRSEAVPVGPGSGLLRPG